ncbi:hypothetical protein XENTR_v10005799 [Xenopus tropicalis]|nr:hypothetical protein XENTR_v10005799 [Xenopus tropicalis]KAE8623997.1 hypothetical protein XENTR_v10005799 [Xenopus tropicalis]KAE8623998.1 hypothetical protein XENTR_v10005799 [Xenopus tropicalis]KAE8623999.1 hypothetical protein XENTR_v10005799 [Xenopus tropicalis]
MTGGNMGYTGADGLGPLETLGHIVINLPAEQRIFLTGQLSALTLAFLFRWHLPTSQCGPILRHSIASLLGICLSIYCFGWLTLFLIGELVLGYLLLLLADYRRVHVYTLFLTMGYLTLFHIQRYLYPAQDQMDFTVPLMMLTQKISRVAFEFHDGHIQTEKPLSPLQRRLAIRTMPSTLSYVSYTLGFLGLLAGPVCSYNDYQIFIHGNEKTGNPNVAVSRKLSLCCLLLAAHLVLSDRFSVSEDPDRSVFSQYLDLYLMAASRRPKYYFAWTLADAINNAAGFGYNGISEDGTERWDLLSNLDIVKIETATSFKMFIDNWNIQTAVWLKELRTKISITIIVYSFSIFRCYKIRTGTTIFYPSSEDSRLCVLCIYGPSSDSWERLMLILGSLGLHNMLLEKLNHSEIVLYPIYVTHTLS